MSLFCGKKCRCKKRCEGFFEDIPAHKQRCKNACKNNKDLSPEEFLLTLTEQQQAAYRGDIPTYCYDQNGNLLSQEYLQSLIDADSTNLAWANDCLVHAPSEQGKWKNIGLVVLVLLIIGGAIIYIKKR